MSDAAFERSNRIKTEYLAYIKMQVENEAEKRLEGIFRPGGDADKQAANAVSVQLGTYPRPITTTFFADKGTQAYSTPTDSSRVMADNARNDALIAASKIYRKHWRGIVKQANVRILESPAAYIATVATHACIKQLGTENKRGKAVRVWYDKALSDPRFVIVQTRGIFKRQSEVNKIGLSSWDRQVDDTKESRDRVQELVERPDEVRAREHFDVSIVRTKEDLKDMMEETLNWCGTAISASDFLTRVILPWCRVEVMGLDDDFSHERKWTHDIPRDAEREAITRMTTQALFEMIDDPQNQEILYLHIFEQWTQASIAAKLDTTEGAIQKRIERILKTLYRKGIQEELLDVGNKKEIAMMKAPDGNAR